MENQNYSYPTHAKILHMGMALFGILAFLTGEGAENGGASSGYLLHAYLGLSLATFVLLRVIWGLAGIGPMCFAHWSPFSRQQWRLAWQDVKSMFQLKLLKRGIHEGLAGLTQAFGLALFGWMGATGTLLFLLGDGPESDIFELAEEAHEIGEVLIPLYLALHVGSVLVHSLVGRPIWQRMWKFRVGPRRDATEIGM